MSLVIYRKYRPKSFSEVIGQEQIKKILMSAISMDRIAHAYLFTGPRGTGKTTIARILAKTINCIDRKDGEPCNKCANCTTINEGKTFDIVEIDAASNTGVDNIRELKTTIGFSPSHLKYKVFIIDEAHMLSKGAFNALLKTLEEPPPHAIFILATTEVHKIPPTIISRAQRFDFHKLKLDEMIKRLGEITKAEKIKAEKGVLEMIAMASDGGMRDAESLLGQIITLAGDDKKIDLAEVKAVLGLTDTESVLKCIEYLSKNETKEAIIFLNDLSFNGQDLEQFAESLIDILRKMLLIKNNPDLAKHIAEDSTEEQIKQISDLGKAFSEQELLWLLKRLVSAKLEIKSASISQMPLELMAIEYGLLKKPKKTAPEEKKTEHDEPERPITGGGKKAVPPRDANVGYNERYAASETIKETGNEYIKEEVIPENKDKDKKDKVSEEKKKSAAKQEKTIITTLEEIKSGWNSVLRIAKNYNHSISAFLKLSAPQSLKGDLLTIATPYKFHAEKLNANTNRAVIEKVLAEVFEGASGARVKVVQDEKVEVAKSPAGKKEADPSIESALDVFGGVVE